MVKSGQAQNILDPVYTFVYHCLLLTVLAKTSSRCKRGLRFNKSWKYFIMKKILVSIDQFLWLKTFGRLKVLWGGSHDILLMMC